MNDNEIKNPAPVQYQRTCEVRPYLYQRFGFCPRCKQQISEAEHPAACGFCGQAVKWG